MPADTTYDEWYDKYVSKDRGKSYKQDTREAKRERMQLYKEMLDLSNKLEIPKNIERVE